MILWSSWSLILKITQILVFKWKPLGLFSIKHFSQTCAQIKGSFSILNAEYFKDCVIWQLSRNPYHYFKKWKLDLGIFLEYIACSICYFYQNQMAFWPLTTSYSVERKIKGSGFLSETNSKIAATALYFI